MGRRLTIYTIYVYYISYACCDPRDVAVVEDMGSEQERREGTWQRSLGAEKKSKLKLLNPLRKPVVPGDGGRSVYTIYTTINCLHTVHR